MAVKGTPRSFDKKFAFIVEIEGIKVAKFTTCSELSFELAKVEQFEGGALTANKSPGRMVFTDITLERGVAYGDYDLYDWALLTANASKNAGLEDDEYKRPVDIIQLSRMGVPRRRYVLDGAWITKFVASAGWDNNADENVLESITLTYDVFNRIPVAA